MNSHSREEKVLMNALKCRSTLFLCNNSPPDGSRVPKSGPPIMFFNEDSTGGNEKVGKMILTNV